MNLIDYIEPVNLNRFSFSAKQRENEFAYLNIDKFDGEKKPEGYQIALLGVGEDRNTPNKGTGLAPDKIREQLYLLNQQTKMKIIDLGNLKNGHTINDTYTALKEVVFELLSKNIVPVIIGGGQDLTYAIYSAFDEFNNTINFVSIDPYFDIDLTNEGFDADSYLNEIILNKGKNLFNYTNLAYQTYYSNKKELALFNKMNFDVERLGSIRSNLQDVEPVMRDADFLSIDIRAVKQSDAPGHKKPSPNGLYSEEICQMVRYAGASDKLKCLGVFEINPSFDSNCQTVGLAAQLIWHFIDGFITRKNDFPVEGTKEYTKHIVSFNETDQNIVFYQNNYNKRWWMEVPYPQKEDEKLIIACSLADYHKACSQEIPERWLKTIQKIN